jgi:hypothetical protein
MPAGGFPPVEHGDAESQVARRDIEVVLVFKIVSLPKTPSQHKSMICQAKLAMEAMTKSRILENWIRDGVINWGSVSSQDGMILVKRTTPVGL